jgi:sulfonate transport system permease protein
LISSNLLVPIERIVALPFSDEAGRHLWAALFASIVRLVLGFAIGATAGIALGALMGASRLADRAVGPSFHALRQIALFAWIPLLTAWFGNGDVPKIVYVAMSAFFPAALNSYIGLRTISVQYFEVADVLRLSQLTRIKRLLLHGALPSIFVGLQIALITAWLGTVSSEYAMGNGRGLGGFLLEGRGQFRMDVVVLGVVVLALVGYLINVGCNKIFRRLLGWQGNAK